MSLIWCVCLGWCVGLGQNLVSTWLHFALFLWFRPLTFLYLLRWIAWRLLIFAWCANPSADRFACFVVCCLVFWTWCSLENSHRKMESKHSARSFFCLDVSAFSCLSLSWLFLFSCHRECIWLALYSSGPCLLFCRISWRQLILMGCARTTCHIWKLHRLMKQIQIIARRRLIWCSVLDFCDFVAGVVWDCSLFLDFCLSFCLGLACSIEYCREPRQRDNTFLS